MEFKAVIENRKSVRSFLDKQVDETLVYKILDAGHQAPSAGNIQPWEFIIVREQRRRREIVDTTFIGNERTGSQNQEWMMQAPVFIVVCADKERSYARYGDAALKSLIYLDCAACIENMLLTAVEVGLASCWVSGFRENELSTALKLPSSHEPIGVLPIGYSNDSTPRRSKRDLDSMIHKETFQE